MVRPLRRAADDGGCHGGSPIRRVVIVVAVLALALSFVLPSWPPVPAAAVAAAPGADDPPVVTGDDERDRYVGSGSVLLPGSFPEGPRRRAAGCPDCQWRLTTNCVRDIEGTCTVVVTVCPPGEEYLRFWLRRPGEGWVRLGSGCVGPGGPVTVDEVDRLVADRFVRDLPDPDPAAQPARGAVTRLPVVFRSGQARRWASRTYVLLGLPVTVRAAPRWTWRFGDGAVLRTSDPGGRWPDDAVAHAYRAAGAQRVGLTTRWTATFTVDGLGPFPVTQPVSQVASLRVRVGEGRAVLVG